MYSHDTDKPVAVESAGARRVILKVLREDVLAAGEEYQVRQVNEDVRHLDV